MIFRLGSFLLFMALSMLLCGLLFQAARHIPFLRWMGRLPGDLRFEGERTTFYFPFTTCVVISLALIVVLRIVRFLLPRL
jgi:hypothetical protein